MALPQVRIHTQTVNPSHPVSHRSNGPSKRVDLTLPSHGYQAIMDGVVQMGKGIVEVGKAIRKVNSKAEGVAAWNAMEGLKGETQGLEAYKTNFAAVW